MSWSPWPRPGTDMLLTVTDLEHRYKGAPEPVFAGLEQSFEPGTLTAVTGPSGCGKSTLLYVLALMLAPSAGSVRWDGVDVHALADADRARLRAGHVGFVFQDAVLDLSRTAEDNVLEAAWFAGIDPDEARSSARELMERFGVGDRADHRPGEVSGGQAQRIALCRALVKAPSIVFADEPSGNLDAVSADVVWDALAEAAASGATVIVATHDDARAATAGARLRLEP
ncbi:ABC transporter ATP-binding protein [Demequina sp.]|uniref:ABC transporter ATP-binding protein n=1 Tax=Demequina sp. TaxID=2050685 RepID=UPI003D0F7D30